MDYELLQIKTIHEVRALTTQKGLRWAKTDKKVQLIKNLMEIPEPPKPNKDVPKLKVVEYKASQDEIIKAIKTNLDRGLKIKFTDDSWHMLNPQGREDTGSLTVPLTVIKKIANILTGA